MAENVGICTRDGKVEKKGVRQTGEYETSILCLDCDNTLLGDLERYAATVLRDLAPTDLKLIRQTDGLTYWLYSGLDYAKFKLFLLSLLWRASISTRSVFQEVTLGPYEEPVRRMIFAGDPGNEAKYPCLIMSYRERGNYPMDLIAQPSMTRLKNGYVHKYAIGGLLYVFFVSRRVAPDWIDEVAINKNGEMKIVLLPEDVEQQVFTHISGVKM